ncbi:hypothetical protein J6I90_00990 [Pseudidiomarina sp. 1APP75-32.1]|uniref:Uncharacterized protein n=1 Tax=Pseudidiomarina terrestris TaxID=2820060 RepID=A0AAW7QXA1_9GAMM|nr:MULTISPECIES: hypothetical protein [unclassified Pseudidiomarina]MDN7123453.1 hypothetical protein [Pseudidiomarina sp. 1APP75-32.1]MDN7128822.1 hypothetical protein [Pseudidiomarina sp. 1APR75-15]
MLNFRRKLRLVFWHHKRTLVLALALGLAAMLAASTVTPLWGVTLLIGFALVLTIIFTIDG